MPLPSPSARRQPGPLGIAVIALAGLASGVALAGLRQLVVQLSPPLTPQTSAAALRQARHWSVDPERRREAALLLSNQQDTPPAERLRLLRGQGWGASPLAAVSLKQAALAAEAGGQTATADGLWQQLRDRFPNEPASADALYTLGRRVPALRRQLLERFPAHPAALAAALESGQALHLARWGARWPGAEPLLRESCQRQQPALTDGERQSLAAALAQLGDGEASLACLGGAAAAPPLQLNLGRALLHGSPDAQRQGEQRLLRLARRHPASEEARQAAALLAQQGDAGAVQTLMQLPSNLKDTPAVQARLALEGRLPWQRVLQRWPQEPSSWDLQWELARKALLQRQWGAASTVLASLDSRLLPAPLAARQLFWQGYSTQQLGRRTEANRLWRGLLAISPGGYYAWRARLRLGEAVAADPRRPSAPPTPAPPSSAAPSWQPLASGDGQLDALWRLGQPLEAWETWRHRRGGQSPRGAEALQLEGRLRTAIGDDWTGLGQLEQAGLRLGQASCAVQWQRELQQHPRRFSAAFRQASERAGLDPDLLLAVARQESRFTPAVSSAVGAVGLLQLMPETAAELAGSPQSTAALQDPSHNAALGARYLRQLLDRWHGNPFLAVASYNAGPGAVLGWLGAAAPDVQREAELWTEAIPYPETRLYTKKVLGNYWTYRQEETRPPC
ncbi:MAG: transglycosylase SLT domain-containing protein [Vulcanococcus sp.]